MVHKKHRSGLCHVRFEPRGLRAASREAESYVDFVTDGISMVHWLFAQGVKPSQILIEGHGVARHIAAVVCAHFHEAYPMTEGPRFASRYVPRDITQGRNMSQLINAMPTLDDLRVIPEEQRATLLGVAWLIPGRYAFEAIPEAYKYVGPDFKKMRETQQGGMRRAQTMESLSSLVDLAKLDSPGYRDNESAVSTFTKY